MTMPQNGGTPERIAVIGLGRLGGALAAVLASRGLDVMGVDLDPWTVGQVQKGLSPIIEPGVQELMSASTERLDATADVTAAVRGRKATFVVVPTPSGSDGTFILDHVLAAVGAIGSALRTSPQIRHTVVITSTVMPGSTDGGIRQTLEASSGLTVGTEVGLCYSPAFIALGSVIQDLTHPDMLLIGESDPLSGDLVSDILLKICDNRPPVMRMTPASAELTKLAVNTFVTTKISYANMLGEICDHIPSADVDDVTRALGMDSRIGTKYLRAATPYGGPCFPRDNVALSAFARQLGVQADLAEATDRINRRQVSRLIELAAAQIPAGARVAVMGLTYKPGTVVFDESFGVAVAEAFRSRGFAVSVYDPGAGAAAEAVVDKTVECAASINACVADASLVVIASPWPEFAGLDPGSLRTNAVLVDCWRQLDPGRYLGVAEVLRPGVGDTTQVRVP